MGGLILQHVVSVLWYIVAVQVTHRNLDITYLILPYSLINAHFTACGVVDLHQSFHVLFGYLAVIVGMDTTVMQAVAGKWTYYNFPTTLCFVEVHVLWENMSCRRTCL